jgi:hypothetical protein
MAVGPSALVTGSGQVDADSNPVRRLTVGTSMSSPFALPFQAPPVRERTEAQIEAEFAADVAALEAHPQVMPDQAGVERAAPLQMSKGARAAATADGLSDDVIRSVIADPQEIEPDPAGEGRMRLRRGSVTVVVARDGTVLSVRGRQPRSRRT